MSTKTVQKQRIKLGKSDVKKSEPAENDEKDTKNENEGTKHESTKIDETTKRVRKILVSSIDPYETPLMWWETAHVRYAINYPPVKSRLEKLMGSYVVRLTDYKYMQKLAESLFQDHVEQQKIRIQERMVPPPSILSRLLKMSYKSLSEQIQDKRNKIKLLRS